MSNYTIIRCEGCGKTFRVYPFQVYEGDIRYCPECNEKSGKEVWIENKPGVAS